MNNLPHSTLPLLLRYFPSVSHAFAYGSGIFPQPGLYSAGGKKGPMIDLIFVVPNAREWHSKVQSVGRMSLFLFTIHLLLQQNLSLNPSHYSWMIQRVDRARPGLGASWVQSIADQVGVGVHFNPLVDLPLSASSSQPLRIKYGVVEVSELDQDLRTWNRLYLAGRMHKPVSEILK